MTTSCKELVELFKSTGGKLECNYITQKCYVYNKTLSCDIDTPVAINEIDKLISDIALDEHVKIFHSEPRNWRYPIENVHKYHHRNTVDITIEFNK